MSASVEKKPEEYLLLKWGTVKGWNFNNEETFSLFKEYADLGMTLEAMDQKDTEEQKNLLCQIIDRIEGEIQNDWSGDVLTKEEAKKYVMEYGEVKS